MSHLDGGTVVAIRDGALVDTDAEEHLGDCSQCQSLLSDALRRSELIGASLAEMDTTIDVAAAKAAVRERLDAHRDGAPRRAGPLPRHMGRAAAILLVAAGAAYAMPGSPVPGWLFDATPEGTIEGPAPVAVQEAPNEGGIEVNVPDGRIRVVVTGVTPGSTVEVIWTDGATARISAAAGSSFSFGDGRAEATVAPGPVRIELPRFAAAVSLEVDGRTYLRRDSAPLEVLEPVAERTDDLIRFVVPER